MKKGVALFALGVLAWTAAGSAFAGPGRFSRAEHPRAQEQRVEHENEGNREEIREENRERERAERNSQQANRGGEPNPGMAPPQMPGGRAGARMSVEERQKLRHQINEAGHSLYTPSGQTGNR